MELFEEDLYRAETAETQEVDINTLTELYQPLIGVFSLSLYLTLYSERTQKEALKHSRLVRLTGCDIDSILKARQQLEKYGLLKTYYSADTNTYLYRLYAPKAPRRFLEHAVFGMQLRSRLERVEYERSRRLFESAFDLKGYKDVSERMVNGLDGMSVSDYENFQREIETDAEDENFGFSSNFDYQRFMNGLTDLQFPLSLRTTENLRFIGALASSVNMDMNEFRKMVLNSIDFNTKTFDRNGLYQRLVRSMDANRKKEVSYSDAPADYLSYCLNNAPVSASSLRILEYLANDLQYSNEVINVIIEICLESNNNRFTRSYVDKIVETFGASNVKTLEDALKMKKILVKNQNSQIRRNRRIYKAEAKKEEEGQSISMDELRKMMEDLEA